MVFVFLSSIYFLTTHLVVSVYIRLNPNRLAGMGMLLGSLLVMAVLMWMMRIQFELVYLIHVAYVLVLYLTRLPPIILWVPVSYHYLLFCGGPGYCPHDHLCGAQAGAAKGRKGQEGVCQAIDGIK